MNNKAATLKGRVKMLIYSQGYTIIIDTHSNNFILKNI